MTSSVRPNPVGGAATTVIDPSNLHWARPPRGPRSGTVRTGALVLAGSSGRVDVGRARMLARHGVTALALRWFGGPGLRPVAREVPIELFADAIGLLAAECDRVVLVGHSYGAEAVLVTASVVPGVSAVVALALTDVVWEGTIDRDDDPAHSTWTFGGRPLPFIAIDRSWQPGAGMPAFVDWYRRSMSRADGEQARAAAIAVERIAGDVVLVAGGDDEVWPSVEAAEHIVARRAAAGLHTDTVIDGRAGHPVVLPGEDPADLVRPYRVGGDAGAPARLGARAWPVIRRVLGAAG